LRLRDVCAARPPFGPGPPRGGATSYVEGCWSPGRSVLLSENDGRDHRGSVWTAENSDGATKEPFSLRRGLGAVAIGRSGWASPGAVGAVSRSWFGQQKGRPSGSPSRVPGSLRPCG
jgi:hypothetical protein